MRDATPLLFQSVDGDVMMWTDAGSARTIDVRRHRTTDVA